MRAQAELSVTSSGVYSSTLCGTELLTLITAVNSASGKTTNCVENTTATSPNTAWAASIDLTGAGGTSGATSANFCVDSTGFAGGRITPGVVGTSASAAVTCPTP